MTEARNCPRCGTRGILPLDQPSDGRGQIADPVMLCPSCQVEFQAEGTTCLGFVRPPDGAIEEELWEWAKEVAAQWLGVESENQLEDTFPDASSQPTNDPGPFFTAGDEGPLVDQERQARLAELEQGLGKVLRRLIRDPGRWILIIEDPVSDRFVQFLAFEDGSLVAEAVSNRFLSRQYQWTRRDLRVLEELGWEPPMEDLRPNYIVVCPTSESDVSTLADLARRTFWSPFGLTPESQLWVKLQAAPQRGHTPLNHADSCFEGVEGCPYFDRDVAMAVIASRRADHEENGERFVMDVADMTDEDIEDLVDAMLDYQDREFRASGDTPGT